MAASLVNARLLMLSQSRRLIQSISTSKCFSSSSSSGGNSDNSENGPSVNSAKEESVPHSVSTDVQPSSVSTSSSSTESALDKFAKVVEKVKKDSKIESAQVTDTSYLSGLSFPAMLRKSKLVSLGEYKGRLVEGEIVETMEDDLYIDFGGKFHCVCPRPQRNGQDYQRGSKVLLNLECLEMSSAFLGSDIHVTLLEADGTLMGLRRKAQAAKGGKRATQS